jgi:hypothetical protein
MCTTHARARAPVSREPRPIYSIGGISPLSLIFDGRLYLRAPGDVSSANAERARGALGQVRERLLALALDRLADCLAPGDELRLERVRAVIGSVGTFRSLRALLGRHRRGDCALTS